MATLTSATADLPIAASVPPLRPSVIRSNRRRRVDPQSGRALEILGHAIEYLTDELVESGELISAGNSRVEAIQMLMALNREVYFDCPEVATFTDRFRTFLHLRSA